MVATGAAQAVAAEVSCDDWNTQAFFERADAKDIARVREGRGGPGL